jgi:hypothetical protein
MLSTTAQRKETKRTSNSFSMLSPTSSQPIQRTPLPWKELSVVLLVLATESTCFQYLFPFVPFMVRSFGVEEENVGFYSGWIASSFMVGQFCSSFFWGRISDVIGIKFVMLTGMTFTAITTVLFGVSHSLEWALTVRFIGGLFNGVIGVTKTYIGLITDETNEAQAFGFMALCWGFGGSVGPAIGGLLSMPSSKYPAIFQPGSLWEEYPFLLPCLVTSMLPTAGIALAVARLKEPDRGKKSKALAPMDTDKDASSTTTSSGSSATAAAATTAEEWQKPRPRHLGEAETEAEGSDEGLAPGKHVKHAVECKEFKAGCKGDELPPSSQFQPDARVVGVMTVAQGGRIHTTTVHSSGPTLHTNSSGVKGSGVVCCQEPCRG